MRTLLCLVLLATTLGCAHQRQYLRPTERVRGQTVNGYDEAFYDLHGANSRFGECKVWSVGAYRVGDDTVVEITMELHNTSAAPIALSAKDLELSSIRFSSGAVLSKVPPQERGTFRVQPQKHASVKLHFLLPPDTSPGELSSLIFKWRIDGGDQSYAQSTPFREQRSHSDAIDRYYLYYSSVYPCSPYDIRCVGPYWPYAPYAPYYPPPPPPHSVRRNVDVRD